MAIKFGEAEFGNLKKQEGTPVERPIPDVLPPWNPNLPRVLPDRDRENCFGNLTPMRVAFNQNSSAWEAVINSPSTLAPTIMLAGENFVVTEKGLYQSKDGETPNKKISSVALAISKIERRWSGKKLRKFFMSKSAVQMNEVPFQKQSKFPQAISKKSSR